MQGWPARGSPDGLGSVPRHQWWLQPQRNSTGNVFDRGPCRKHVEATNPNLAPLGIE